MNETKPHLTPNHIKPPTKSKTGVWVVFGLIITLLIIIVVGLVIYRNYKTKQAIKEKSQQEINQAKQDLGQPFYSSEPDVVPENKPQQ